MYFLLSLLLILIGSQLIFGQQCNMTIEVADNCGKTLSFFGDRDVLVPQNEDEMNQHCKVMFDSVKCLRKFSRTCLPGFPQQAFSIFTYDMLQVIRKRCHKQADRVKFVEYSRCWPREKLGGVFNCNDRHIIQLEFIKQRADPADKITGICCAFHQRHDCIKQEVTDLCQNNPESVNYVVETIDDIASDVMDFVCGSFQSTKDCDKNFNPTIWDQLKQIVNTTDETVLASLHKYKSILPPTVEILTNFKL